MQTIKKIKISMTIIST